MQKYDEEAVMTGLQPVLHACHVAGRLARVRRQPQTASCHSLFLVQIKNRQQTKKKRQQISERCEWNEFSLGQTFVLAANSFSPLFTLLFPNHVCQFD